MAALTLGDEHPLFSGSEILKTQSEDLAAAKPTQEHGLDHGPVALRA